MARKDSGPSGLAPKKGVTKLLALPWPSQFHHTGPFHDGKGRDEIYFPWERLTGEPVIYASKPMGSPLQSI
jgi:hypothetical protein